ncbi:MAG: aldehyde dehydrogenase [Flavobacterium sp.]|nr:aldehyde dehydrogenase [Flavobacterium sp.]
MHILEKLPKPVFDRSVVSYRKETLKKILYQVQTHEADIVKALQMDLGKPEFEAVINETNYVISDLKHAIKNIDRWNKPQKVRPSILNFPSTDYIFSEPYGKVLIMAPWNYPFQLALCPAIAAVAAGNHVTLKPSELTPATSSAVSRIISYSCHPDLITVVEGGPALAEKLLEKRWDYIFFTGSVTVGKIIAEAAAKNLTPTTLELGGKNPCIIHPSANMELAARRIVWGKFVNAGQTCIAPDYILVHEDDEANFISLLKAEIIKAYGSDASQSRDYQRIVNIKHWERLVGLIDPEDIAYGGRYDREKLYIEPTIIDENTLDSKLMQDEIFGPIIPVISYVDDHDIAYAIEKFRTPLALYVFAQDMKYAEKTIRKYAFGGGCINDTMVHFVNRRLPFGGVGESGMGSYHGKNGFDIFTHKKSVVKKATWLDVPLRYAPYGNKIKKIKKWLRWLT